MIQRIFDGFDGFHLVRQMYCLSLLVQGLLVIFVWELGVYMCLQTDRNRNILF